ncbi:MAG: hypothetical protein RLZZ303_337, partial [Candidatus Hydrogenedentota bacterium]
MVNDFIALSDFSREEIEALLELADDLKARQKSGRV